MNLIDSLKSAPLLKEFDDDELTNLQTYCSLDTIPAGSEIVKEGETGFDFSIVISGKAGVLKAEAGREHHLDTIGPGETIGELNFIEGGKREASVVAIEPCEVIRIDGARLREEPSLSQLHTKVLASLAQLLSRRLDYTNKVTVRSMQATIEKSKEQLAVGIMLIAIILLTSGYQFILGSILSFKNLLPSTTPISVGMLTIFAIVLFFAIKKGGFPLRNYGLTLEKGWAHIRGAILYTLPVLGFILLFKWVLIQSFQQFHNYKLFEPFTTFKGGIPALSTYALTVFAYSLFCPIQEFIARGAIQSSLQMFIGKKTNLAIMTSILLSNMLFASAHMHTSIQFALLAFIPGLFWGWLYYKQYSLIGVSISHIMLGVWVSFIVGWQGLA